MIEVNKYNRAIEDLKHVTNKLKIILFYGFSNKKI